MWIASVPEPLLDGAMDHALQAAAMDRELRHVVAGIEAARLAPDFLAVAVEIVQFVGADRDGVEPVQQPEAGQFADRMRQRVDADAEFADGVGLLEQFAVDAARPQHQRGGEAADAASDDDRLHPPELHSTEQRVIARPSSVAQAGLFGRKRLCRLGLQLGAGFRLTLNFEVLEILPVAHAVAENLLLAGQILRRTGDIRRRTRPPPAS